jgi:hypothetical protein
VPAIAGALLNTPIHTVCASAEGVRSVDKTAALTQRTLVLFLVDVAQLTFTRNVRGIRRYCRPSKLRVCTGQIWSSARRSLASIGTSPISN